MFFIEKDNVIMKKTIAVIFSVIAVFCLSACAETETENNTYSDLNDSNSSNKSNGLNNSNSPGKSSGSSKSKSSSKSSGSSKSKSSSKKRTSSDSNQSFEDYLKENDPDSYKFYKGLKKGYDSGKYDSENGFYQP